MDEALGIKDLTSTSPDDTQGMYAVWIDDSGREVPHFFVDSTIEARRRAFTFMRMVEVVKHGTHLILRWNVKHVSPQAVSTAAVVLAESAPETIVTLEFFWGAWARESGFKPAGALRRMIDIAPYAHVIPFLGTKMHPIDPVHVRHEGDLIRRTFEHWDTDHKNGDYPAGPDGLGPYSGVSLAFNYDTTESNLMIRHVGRSSTAVTVFGEAWATESLGRACVRSQPDFEYEERVCSDYDDVMANGDVKVDHVRAFIRRPNNDPVWVTYKRLLMRSRNSLGVPTLVAISEWADDIAIPLMAA